MNAMNQFEHLAALARRETPPQLDVVRGVLRAVAPSRLEEPVDRPLLVCSGLSAVAAAAALVVIVQSWSVVEPVAYLFNSMSMVLQ